MRFYTLYNKITGETDIFMGYDFKDMQKRYPDKNWDEWKILTVDYVD